MRVLVTGGLGFLGRAVSNELADHGHEVIILSHTFTDDSFRGFPVIHTDLRERAMVAKSLGPLDIDGVCHLAGLTSIRDSFADPLGYFDTNLGGTANLLRASRDGIPFVMTSTSAVYGSARPGQLSEDLPPSAENPYAASKLAAEQLLAYTTSAGMVGGVTLRCFNVAGAVDGYADPDPTRIISATLRAAAGLIPHLTVNGDGSAVREFTHVLDVAVAVRLGLEGARSGAHHTFNVGTGHGVQMIDIIRAAEDVTGRKIEVVHRPSANEAHTLVSDPSRIQHELGWKPARSTITQIIADAWKAFYGEEHVSSRLS